MLIIICKGKRTACEERGDSGIRETFLRSPSSPSASRCAHQDISRYRNFPVTYTPCFLLHPPKTRSRAVFRSRWKIIVPLNYSSRAHTFPVPLRTDVRPRAVEERDASYISYTSRSYRARCAFSFYTPDFVCRIRAARLAATTTSLFVFLRRWLTIRRRFGLRSPGVPVRTSPPFCPAPKRDSRKIRARSGGRGRGGGGGKLRRHLRAVETYTPGKISNLDIYLRAHARRAAGFKGPILALSV